MNIELKANRINKSILVLCIFNIVIVTYVQGQKFGTVKYSQESQGEVLKIKGGGLVGIVAPTKNELDSATSSIAEFSTKFYEFSIPSVINGANIDPSPVSNFNANFTDSKLTAKVGFPFSKKEIKDLRYSGFLSASAKAANGVTTAFKTTGAPAEYTFSAGGSHLIRHLYYVSPVGGKTTQIVNWITINGSFGLNNYNLFNESAAYDDIKTSISPKSYSLYISLNRYFHSELRGYRLMNVILSGGIGVAKTNNYSSLKQRSYETGTVIHNPNGSGYKSVSETIAGAIGDFRNYEGITYYIEIFKSIIRSERWGAIYWGNRGTQYAVGNKETIINGNTGFYFSLKNGEKEVKDRKDVLSFSISAQFNQLNKTQEKDYMDKNFSVMVQTAVPLRFN